jgi:hypothetical protein
MREQVITVEIDADGRITADAEGFEGDACLATLDKLLIGLGALEATERKPDRDSRATRNETRRQTKGT